MRVLGFGTYDPNLQPRVAIILAGLGEQGDTVLSANAPIGFTTTERIDMVARPWTGYRFVARLAARWATIARQGRRIAHEGRVDAVVVGYMGHFDVVLARAVFPRSTVVLDQMVFAADTAKDRRVDSRAKLKALEAVDRLAVACSDVVVVDTPEHLEHLEQISPRNHRKGVVVPVGASRLWFQARPDRNVDPSTPLRVVFYGLYTPLQGAPVIGEALALLAGDEATEVTMIGTGQDLAATKEAAAMNRAVTWIDWVDPEELPGVVARHDVCLGIFGTSPKALRVVPNKVYQGAAAGRAIVTSDTAPQRRAFGDTVRYVSPGNAAALAAGLRELARDRELLRRLQDAAAALASTLFTPGAVVTPLRTRLREGAGRSDELGLDV